MFTVLLHPGVQGANLINRVRLAIAARLSRKIVMLYWTVVQYPPAARAIATGRSHTGVFVGPKGNSAGVDRGQDTVGLILHPFEGRDDDGYEDQRSRRNCAGGLSCCPKRIVRCEKKSSIRSELARRPTDPKYERSILPSSER